MRGSVVGSKDRPVVVALEHRTNCIPCRYFTDKGSRFRWDGGIADIPEKYIKCYRDASTVSILRLHRGDMYHGCDSSVVLRYDTFSKISQEYLNSKHWNGRDYMTRAHRTLILLVQENCCAPPHMNSRRWKHDATYVATVAYTIEGVHNTK